LANTHNAAEEDQSNAEKRELHNLPE